MKPLDTMSSAAIRQCLLDAKKITSQDVPMPLVKGSWRDAAVLMPLLRMDRAWHLLFIRRPQSSNDHHGGQVAFPGGKYEETDESLLITALREAEEEIGIRSKDVQVLGELGQHYSVSGYQITPVVAQISWPYPLVLSEQEVARAFTIPLIWLAQGEHYEFRYRASSDGTKRPIAIPYFNEYDGELLWGATARMTLSLLETLK